MWKMRCHVASYCQSKNAAADQLPEQWLVPEDAMLLARHLCDVDHCAISASLQGCLAAWAAHAAPGCCRQFLEQPLARIFLSMRAACFLAGYELLHHLLLPSVGPPKPRGLRSPTDAQACQRDWQSEDGLHIDIENPQDQICNPTTN